MLGQVIFSAGAVVVVVGRVGGAGAAMGVAARSSGSEPLTLPDSDAGFREGEETSHLMLIAASLGGVALAAT